MKQKFSAFMMIVSALALAAIIVFGFGIQPARAQDTYNFYFQKGGAAQVAPAPLAQPQSANPTAVETPSIPLNNQTPPATQVATKSGEANSSKDDFPQFTLGLGAHSIFSDSGDKVYKKTIGRRSDTGIRADLGFNMNRYVGILAGVTYVPPTKEIEDSPGNYELGKTLVFGAGGDLSLVFTPIRARISGFEIFTLSLLGGGTVMSAGKLRASDASYCPGNRDSFAEAGNVCPPQWETNTFLVEHYGARVGINLDKHFGITGEYRRYGRTKYLNEGDAAMFGINFQF